MLEDFVGDAHMVDEAAVCAHLHGTLCVGRVLDDDGCVAPVYVLQLGIAVIRKSHAYGNADYKQVPVAEQVEEQVHQVDGAVVVFLVHNLFGSAGPKKGIYYD